MAGARILRLRTVSIRNALDSFGMVATASGRPKGLEQRMVLS